MNKNLEEKAQKYSGNIMKYPEILSLKIKNMSCQMGSSTFIEYIYFDPRKRKTKGGYIKMMNGIEENTEKEIVIITYDMIPYAATWGGSQRMYYLAEYLSKKNMNVTVFSCKKNTYNNYGNKISFNHISIPIKNKLLHAFLFSKGQSNFDNNKKKYSTINLMRLIRKKIKNNKYIFKTITIIDKKIYNEPGFLSGFISRSWVSNIIDQITNYIYEHNVKDVIISAPPFGMFSIAKLLKKRIQELNIIFDYRDPWNLWHDRSIFAKKLEREYLQFADKVVCTNENLVHGMLKEFDVSLSKFFVIENGYSEYAWSDISLEKKSKSDSMVMTYVGIMDMSISSHCGYRDISVLLKVFEKCLNEGLKMKLKFVGVSNPNSEYAKQLKNKFKDNIDIIGIVDNRKAIQFMVDSNILLLLHTTKDNSSKYLVSGKIYDYIKANRFIFFIGDSNSIHHQKISSLKLGISSENLFSELYKKIKYMYSLWEENKLEIEVKDIYKYSREFQNEKYYMIINEKEG